MVSSAAFAQTSEQSASPTIPDAAFEIGAHLGDLLPNQIHGVTEIMGLGGLRIGARFSPRSYFEGGIIMGNGSGQQWRDLHADVRMDSPVENLLASAYVGADSVMYKGVDQGQRIIFGGHVGGAIQARLGQSTYFRGDMKFSFSPGTSLYFGVGIVFRLGSESASGS
jgi:hypothetical protein